ncbi:MAG TPA: chemotaxis protein CheX [Polyangiaceae bacterium]|nr:chemotaxis protein CheX [Polyangiaceae bacterium]
MKSCFAEVLDDILLRSAEALFKERGIDLSANRSQPPSGGSLPPPAALEAHVAAFVPFSGAAIRGSLMLVCPFDIAAAGRGRRAGAVLSTRVASDWIVARDWVGELANLLLGRIKNRLLAFRVEFSIAPPVPLSGRALAVALQANRAARQIAFGRGDQIVRVLIDVVDEPALMSTKPHASAEPSALEGDVIEF